MKNVFWKVDSVVSKFAIAVTMFAGLLTAIQVVLLFGQIVLRNLNVQLQWSGEVSELLIMWIFLLPMAYTQLDGGMVRITFFTKWAPVKLQRWLELLPAVSCVVFALILFKSSSAFYSLAVSGGYYPETYLPNAIQRAGVPLCSLLLFVAGVICLVRAVFEFASKEKRICKMEGE